MLYSYVSFHRCDGYSQISKTKYRVRLENGPGGEGGGWDIQLAAPPSQQIEAKIDKFQRKKFDSFLLGQQHWWRYTEATSPFKWNEHQQKCGSLTLLKWIFNIGSQWDQRNETISFLWLFFSFSGFLWWFAFQTKSKSVEWVQIYCDISRRVWYMASQSIGKRVNIPPLFSL